MLTVSGAAQAQPPRSRMQPKNWRGRRQRTRSRVEPRHPNTRLSAREDQS